GFEPGQRISRRLPGSRASALEDGLAGRAHIHDLAALQLELGRLVAGELHREQLAVVPDELGADLEAEVDDALHLRLPRRAVRLAHDLQIARTHPRLADPVRLADERPHAPV